MNIAVQIAASLSILSKPFMPFTAKKLCNILSIEELVWKEAKKLILKKGHKINSGDHLFLKIEDEEIKTQLKKLQLQ